MSKITAPRKTVLDGLGGPRQDPAGQLWQVPTFFAGLLALALVALVNPFAQGNNQLDQDLADLRRGLSQVNPDLDRLVPLAEKLLDHSRQYPQHVGEIHYLVGTAYMKLADRSPAEQAQNIRAKALAHLEQAEARGVANADRNRLLYRLGRVVFQSGGELKRAIDYLNRGSPLGGEDASEGYGLLVQAYLKLPQPDLDAALRANKKQIDFSDDDGAVAEARLVRADLLLRKEQRGEAIQELDKIGRKATRPLQQRAAALLARCCQEEGIYDRAIKLWQDLLAEPAVVPGGKGRILYMLAICYEQIDPPQTAKARQTFEEAQGCGGEEAQAAALRLANSFLGDRQPFLALAPFQFALETVPGPTAYKNSLIDLATAREMMDRGCNIFKQRHEHHNLQLLAEVFQKIAVPGVAEERLAEAAEEYGKYLLAQAGKEHRPAVAKKLLEQARSQFRRAAQAYLAAGKTQNFAEYLNRQARAANCLLEAQDYPQAVDLLVVLQRQDVPAAKQAEAWLAVGRAYQGMQKSPEEVEGVYNRCVKFDIDPPATQALYQLAQMAAARGDLKEAERLFTMIAERGQKQPSRQSELISTKLAELYIQQGNYDQARVRLQEIIRHSPNSPQLPALYDQLGDCCRKLADKNLADSNNGQQTLTMQSFYRGKHREHLEEARGVYQKLADDLEARTTPLSPTEEGLLRKSLFIATDCLADLGQSGEALRRYEELAKRYQNRLEGLIACQRLYSCFNQITDDLLKQRARDVTRAAVTTALGYLPAMPSEGFPTNPPGSGKQEWLNYLNHVQQMVTPH